MSSTQPLDEATILNRFLLQPSSLPVILPYKAFLSLLPQAVQDDESLKRPLRRLYTTLQFQRNIDVDHVRETIAREVANGGNFKARLRKAIAREMDGSMDDDEAVIIDLISRPTPKLKASRATRVQDTRSPELEMSRKRKRSSNDASEGSEDEDDTTRGTEAPPRRVTRSSTALSEQQDENNSQEEDPEDDGSSSDSDEQSDHEIPESPSSSPPPEIPSSPSSHIPPNNADTLLDYAFHGPRGLGLSSTYDKNRPQSTFHSRTSLLSAMESAVRSLQTEITMLDSEAKAIMKNMQVTVGDLSDLRYGKFARDNAGQASLEEGVLEELRGLRDAVGRGQ